MAVKFSFFIIVSNNELEFEIHATAMKDWRLRCSSLKSQWRRYKTKQIGEYKSMYNIFDKDHSCYLIDTRMCDQKTTDVVVKELYSYYFEKFSGAVKHQPSGLIQLR